MANDTATVPSTAPMHASAPARLVSIDAYRGFVMLLMMGEVLNLCRVARNFPESRIWKFLCYNQSHVEWIGCSLHDLIQPSFSFLVGVALPFSIASRRSKGQSTSGMISHACVRALILIFLGVFLRSMGRPQTYFTFEDTLSQIGLGYPFLFVLAFAGARLQWSAFTILVAGYWAAFALFPLPGPDFDYSKVGVSASWLADFGQKGFAEHWNKNSNLAWAFDTWFLNLFPRERLFRFNGGGYSTLSFIPTLATMTLGLFAGQRLRSAQTEGSRIKWFAVAGVMGLVLGCFFDLLGICPVVKRIWTPSWVLFSGGCCFLLLALFYSVIDVLRFKRWSFFLSVVGMNSIAAYCMAHLFEGFVLQNLKTNLGQNFFKMAGNQFEPLLQGAATLFVFWLILYWMFKRKIFLRI